LSITGGLRYLGYSRTLIVAPELVVQWLAEAFHSVGGRSGTHLLLRVPTQDSVVRPWSKSLHGCDSESCSGTHHVAPEVEAELEAWSEASFICTVLIFADDSCEPLNLSG
jgi:hypothetical protein